MNTTKSPSRRDILRIAQRFSAGLRTAGKKAPKGRLIWCNEEPFSAVPSGLGFCDFEYPTLKRWAIASTPFGTGSIGALSALLLFLFGLLPRAATAASASSSTNPSPIRSDSSPPSTPREFFNAGTSQLQQGKLREAEALLQTVLGAQDERLQPSALYNLGHVRFGQGLEELKKGPGARPSTDHGRAASQSTDDAIHEADEALAGNDVQKLVAAYLRGRGARKGLKEATKVVRQALESYGTALSKWQRASGDFKSTLELRPADSDARQNADVVDRCIAKLVDTLQQLQQLANAMGQKKQELGEKMKQLKGRIPDEDMPPGAAGDDDEEEEQPNGTQPGEKESAGKEGEQQMTLSPEQAGWLLDGFKLDADRRLPMGQNDSAEPKSRSRKPW